MFSSSYLPKCVDDHIDGLFSWPTKGVNPWNDKPTNCQTHSKSSSATNCLNEFDHLAGLALKGLSLISIGDHNRKLGKISEIYALISLHRIWVQGFLNGLCSSDKNSTAATKLWQKIMADKITKRWQQNYGKKYY